MLHSAFSRLRFLERFDLGASAGLCVVVVNNDLCSLKTQHGIFMKII